ncbi:MAG: FeoB-associated Cys-rich membrane protein [Clostridiales bacterium]|nr:FeoB-associated Cys-rich membrane protein [Clostridiales bacterium]
MKAIEIIVIVFAVALVLFTIVYNAIKKQRAKKSGRPSCCGGCSSCPYGGSCLDYKEKGYSENDKSITIDKTDNER